MELKRLFFLSLGITSFSVGAAGAVIPVLPTTPFILISFFCFGKSSKKAEMWISNNKYFGSFIENYETKRGVPWDVKLKSIVFLWMMLIISSIIFSDNYYLPILFLTVGIAVTTHIMLLKTRINSNQIKKIAKNGEGL